MAISGQWNRRRQRIRSEQLRRQSLRGRRFHPGRRRSRRLFLLLGRQPVGHAGAFGIHRRRLAREKRPGRDNQRGRGAGERRSRQPVRPCRRRFVRLLPLHHQQRYLDQESQPAGRRRRGRGPDLGRRRPVRSPRGREPGLLPLRPGCQWVGGAGVVAGRYLERRGRGPGLGWRGVGLCDGGRKRQAIPALPHRHGLLGGVGRRLVGDAGRPGRARRGQRRRGTGAHRGRIVRRSRRRRGPYVTLQPGQRLSRKADRRPDGFRGPRVAESCGLVIRGGRRPLQRAPPAG